MNAVFTRLVHPHVGRRGTFLMFLALLDFTYGYALAFPTPQARLSPTYAFLSRIVPLWLWGTCWILVGLVCAVYAFRRNDGVDYAAAMLIKVVWAIMFLLGWLFAGVERGYLSTAIWGAFAGVLGIISTWPEEPGTRHES